MSNILEIVPKVVPQPDIIYTKLRYFIQAVYPNEKAVLAVLLFTEDLEQKKSFHLELKQPEYASWGSDDSFIIDWILRQLEVELKPTII